MFIRIKNRNGDYKKVINIYKIISFQEDTDGDTEIEIETGTDSTTLCNYEPLGDFLKRLKQEPKEYEHLSRLNRFEILDI